MVTLVGAHLMMKRNHALTFIALLFSCMVGCESNESSEPSTTKSPLPSSMKGYELYSWRTDNQWNYTLITGTNRTKAYDEIVAAGNVESEEWIKISVQGLTNVLQLLDRLPANETISWINSPSRVSGFSLPEFQAVVQIQMHCKRRELNLQVIQ